MCTGKVNFRRSLGDLAPTGGTVKFYVSALMRKLGVCKRSEAIKTATEQGLVGR